MRLMFGAKNEFDSEMWNYLQAVYEEDRNHAVHELGVPAKDAVEGFIRLILLVLQRECVEIPEDTPAVLLPAFQRSEGEGWIFRIPHTHETVELNEFHSDEAGFATLQHPGWSMSSEEDGSILWSGRRGESVRVVPLNDFSIEDDEEMRRIMTEDGNRYVDSWKGTDGANVSVEGWELLEWIEPTKRMSRFGVSVSVGERLRRFVLRFVFVAGVRSFCIQVAAPYVEYVLNDDIFDAIVAEFRVIGPEHGAPNETGVA